MNRTVVTFHDSRAFEPRQLVVNACCIFSRFTMAVSLITSRRIVKPFTCCFTRLTSVQQALRIFFHVFDFQFETPRVTYNLYQVLMRADRGYCKLRGIFLYLTRVIECVIDLSISFLLNSKYIDCDYLSQSVEIDSSFSQ